MLDCHDGIPVRPDLDGHPRAKREMLDLADLVQRRGGNVNRILSEAHADGDVDVHQLNCTYYAALDCDDDRYVTARAIQLFARGVPQIYYVGLLAGENDHAAVAESGEGRAINRHNYSTGRGHGGDGATGGPTGPRPGPVAERRSGLWRIARRQHGPSASSVRMAWTSGDDCCELEADLASGRSLIRTRHDGVEVQFAP